MEKVIFKEFNILKGIGIYLVILGHVGFISQSVIHFIFSFHMPLFIFVSGFFYKKATFKDFLIKKGKRILVPYFLFSFISFFMYYLLNYKNSKFSFFDFIKGTLLGISNDFYLSWNTVLWFLPALFILNFIYLFLDKYRLKFLIIFLFCIGVYFANDVTKIFPFHIISVFLFFPFFVVGIVLKKHYLTFKNKIRNWYFIPFLIMGLIFMNLNKLTPDLRVNIIGNPFVFYLSSFLLIFALLLLSCIVYKEKITEWLGINSLLIMCLHLKFLFLAQWICLKISIDNGFIVSLFLCVILYFPVVFIKKYLPILEGN